jgi:hypothetical protein
MESCTFETNKASVTGGAIDFQETPASYKEHLNFVLRNSNNSANHYISDCAFFNNSVCQSYSEIFSSQMHVWQESKSRETLRPPGFPIGVVPCSGGAISVVLSQIVVSKSIFEYNAAGYSGGAINGLSTLRTSTFISATRFQSNVAGAIGGALVLGENPYSPYPSNAPCQAVVKDSEFVNNVADFGGAFMWSPSASCKIAVNGGTCLLQNLIFQSNLAWESGGAVFASYLRHDALYQYQNITFSDNTAISSGGTFFYNPSWLWDELNFAPDFCIPSFNCTVTNTHSSQYLTALGFGQPLLQISGNSSALNTKQAQTPKRSQKFEILANCLGVWPAPLWGPIQASGGWSAHFDTSSLEDPIWEVGGVDLPYHFTDMYEQVVFEKLAMGVVVEPPPSLSPMGINGSILSIGLGDGVIKLSLAVNKSLSRDPTQGWTEGDQNPFQQPVSLFGLLKLIPRSYSGDQSAFIVGSLRVSIALQAFSCSVGEGLWPIPSDSSLVACAPCPIGTYNLAADGQCYSCKDAGLRGGASELTCERSNVAAVTGFWTSEALSLGHSNRLFVAKCRPGYCINGACVKGRCGILCGDCTEGHWESLLSACETFCTRPSVGFLVLLAAVLVISTIVIHFGIQLAPRATMHVLATLVLGAIFLAPHLDRVLPLRWRWLASIVCGFRANAAERTLFLSFAPYVSVALLILAMPLSTLLENRVPNKIALLTSPLRLARSSFALLLTLALPATKFAVDWTQCIETPLGRKWSFGPTFDCGSPEFSRYRIASIVALSTLIIVPTTLAVALLISVLLKRPFKWLGLEQIFIDPLSRSRATVTILIELCARLCIVIIYSTLYSSIDTRSVVAGGLLMGLLILQSVVTSSTSRLERIAVAISYSVLSIMAVSDPLVENSTTYPFAALASFLAWLVGLAICLTIASRHPQELKDIDSIWQEYNTVAPEQSNSETDAEWESEHDHIPLRQN